MRRLGERREVLIEKEARKGGRPAPGALARLQDRDRARRSVDDRDVLHRGTHGHDGLDVHRDCRSQDARAAAVALTGDSPAIGKRLSSSAAGDSWQMIALQCSACISDASARPGCHSPLAQFVIRASCRSSPGPSSRTSPGSSPDSSPTLAAPALIACGGLLALSAVGAAAAAHSARAPAVRRPRGMRADRGDRRAGGARCCSARDAHCVSTGWAASDWRAVRSSTPCDAAPPPGSPRSALEAGGDTPGARIDSLFGSDAPLVRALLIADMRAIPPDTRDRFAAAGLVHILSISGLHVAIIAGAVLLVFEALRMPRARARWAALGVTAAYVAAIGAPPPALRSAAMLAVATASRSLDRPVSPWAVLALGALIPLYDPHTVNDIGWQLSTAGFAALTAAGIWTRRHLPHDLRGWRRTLARDLAVSVLATVVTAPLVVWVFGRFSLVASAHEHRGVAGDRAAAAHALPGARGGAGPRRRAVRRGRGASAAGRASTGSRPPARRCRSVRCTSRRRSAPTAACGAAAVALVVAAASRPHAAGRALLASALSATVAIWWIAAPAGSGFTELHMIDVGEGDAVAIRTPRGSWLLVDAGRSWTGGDAGRRFVVPYLRRFGGELALFVATHPDADHVGGAASIVAALRPDAYRDAAFAGGSEPYRKSLDRGPRGGRGLVARARRRFALDRRRERRASSRPIRRGPPGCAIRMPRASSRSCSTARCASSSPATRTRPRRRGCSSTPGAELHADVLKVGHHGSSTSSSAPFLDAVQPRLALVSVGRGKRLRPSRRRGDARSCGPRRDRPAHRPARHASSSAPTAARSGSPRPGVSGAVR